ncbi:KxDL motif-containing protein 1 [Trichinella pseudospiralis]|uniref:KxDL motif-containing protein 1 n=2 Tax=Trichinella pseudospiralis TaxID=6337 RepID=A0A0V1EJI2_TRIPS|nr:KxDL motif-containing protein 1 [Trichinella pseudospiralis]KRY89081.1 KxDL motif-containing protein 1 [Trichinella pseudospiralis]KRZ19866.1 KxDL motif-containing protein 1 [Trichinella pseudospiralis]KRZ44886.1 KxDL motif-containing protein 1 [Trichinella pseudospiralis]
MKMSLPSSNENVAKEQERSENSETSSRIAKIFEYQREILFRLEKSNEMLKNCVKISSSRIDGFKKDFAANKEILMTIKTDLDYIYNFARKHGKAFPVCSNSFLEDDKDQQNSILPSMESLRLRRSRQRIRIRYGCCVYFQVKLMPVPISDKEVAKEQSRNLRTRFTANDLIRELIVDLKEGLNQMKGWLEAVRKHEDTFEGFCAKMDSSMMNFSNRLSLISCLLDQSDEIEN